MQGEPLRHLHGLPAHHSWPAPHPERVLVEMLSMKMCAVSKEHLVA